MDRRPIHCLRQRFPSEVIGHAVCLYFRLTLSCRGIEDLLASRGLGMSCETVRQWCLKFGQSSANVLRRFQPQPGDKWNLDEVLLTINCKIHYLWRAVDRGSHVLDILVHSRGNRHAAKWFFRKLLKGLHYAPRVLITDKRRSYASAKREILPGVEHRQHKGLNKRAEVSLQPTRQKERQRHRFKSLAHAQRFLSVHGPINNLLRCRHNRLSRTEYWAARDQAFATWGEVAITRVRPENSEGVQI